MCGITGIINKDKNNHVEPGVLHRMSKALEHRGPDDEGFYINKNVGLGFRRLSIIDLKSGNQPISNENGTVWIVFNGEIYNYLELKKLLIAKGHTFKTTTDTEVIVHLYEEYGLDTPNYLRGMFAFTIYDLNQEIIFCVRDRFGIKPFYFLNTNTAFVFGSELKSIISAQISKREIDLQALDSYFTYGYIISPFSIYKDIKKIKAGHYIVLDLKKNNVEPIEYRYWKPSFDVDFKLSFDESKELIKNKLADTVKAHLVSDVPVGVFLSGGIDSNSILSQMVKYYPQKVKTFTIGFNEREFNEASDAKESAALYNTEHFELILKPESATVIEDIISLYDEPFGDSSAIPTYFVSKLASQHVKVVLSGDGGDEFFGGYLTYQRLKKINSFHIPLPMRKILFGILSKILPEKLPGKRFANVLSKDPKFAYAYFNNIWEGEKKRFYNADILSIMNKNPTQSLKLKYLIESTATDFLSRMMELDTLTYLPDDILKKVDIASMANSLEVRVPIIDHEFFKIASRIPSEFKINKGTGKYVFREALKSELSDLILKGSKRGFAIPIEKWFKSNLNEFVNESLSSTGFLEGFINKNYLLKLKNTKNPGSLISRIWPLLAFNIWYQRVHKRN